MKWKVESSEYVFRERWLRIRRDAVRLQNGHLLPEYYIIETVDFVGTLAITTEGQMVLVRQYRHGIGETHYELCAGLMEPEETDPLAAAKRELQEETGYGGGEWTKWETLSQNPAIHNNWMHIYLAVGVEKVGGQDLDDGEELTVHLFSPAEVRGLLLTGGIVQALHAAPLWHYLATQGGKESDKL